MEIMKLINTVELRSSLYRGIKSYVLRNNTLNADQIDILNKAGSDYYQEFINEELDAKTLFKDKNKEVIIEIGFGMGTATKQIAKDRSEYNYLGLEVYLDGFTKLLSDVYAAKLDNIRLMRFNAVDVLENMIKDNSIEGFHIFFPDPWPKKRHHKRRLIQKEFVELMAKKLKKGGYLYIATDWVEYAEYILEVLNECSELENKYDKFAPKVEWRKQTKFEKKGLDKNYSISEIWFEKV